MRKKLVTEIILWTISANIILLSNTPPTPDDSLDKPESVYLEIWLIKPNKSMS